MPAFKYCYRELFTLIHPHAVTHVKIAGKRVPDEVMRSVMGFLAIYLGIFALASVVLAGMGVDFTTSFGAVAATLGNIGPGFAAVGPVDNFAHIPVLGKWLLIWCMLVGRKFLPSSSCWCPSSGANNNQRADRIFSVDKPPDHG